MDAVACASPSSPSSPSAAALLPPTSTLHRRPQQQSRRLQSRRPSSPSSPPSPRPGTADLDAACAPRSRSRSPATSSCSSPCGRDHDPLHAKPPSGQLLGQQPAPPPAPPPTAESSPAESSPAEPSPAEPPPTSSRRRRHCRLAPLPAAHPAASAPSAPSAAVSPSSTSPSERQPPPEVISSLITSLADVLPPSSASYLDVYHFSPGVRRPESPARPSPRHSSGSFGVDYGAFNSPGLDPPAREPLSLDDIAASAPVVRTAKPPSGFSPLTAPSANALAPARGASSCDGLSGLRSLIRTASASCPSSRGSATSKNEDAHSIGNLSIERASAPTPDLRPRRSLDSWGKKATTGSRGLMYVTSRERLREKDLERKRPSFSSQVPGSVSGSGHDSPDNGQPASPLVDTAIREETEGDLHIMASPNPVPSRDSSLRGTASRRKRPAPRHSKRDGEFPWGDAILEDEEHLRVRGHDTLESDMTALADKSFLLGLEDEFPTPPRSTPTPSRQARTRHRPRELTVELPVAERDDESAPSPAISSGRRRAERSAERKDARLAGRQSPAPRDALKLRRSSSKLKRLSAGPLSPRSESRISAASPEPSYATSLPAGNERPGSADSVDDAVESYLCSPRLSQKIRHPQTGRVISFSEVGDADGSAVFCCVGMGLTRYITAFYDELALTLKLRLITPDRPGVGESDPYSDGTATPLGWPDDVYAICQALKITKFSILAHSAGAIYALATALRMPQHIRGRIHLLAPWIPPSQMNVFGSTQALPPTNAIPTSQKILRALPTPILKAANSSFMTATSSSITSSLPKNPRRTKRKAANNRELNGVPSRNATPMIDADSLGQGAYGRDGEGIPGPLTATENMDRMQPSQGAIGGGATSFAPMADRERQVTYDTRLTHAIWELATTGANPAVDLLVCLERRHAIGFRYVDITRPVVIHHGSRDARARRQRQVAGQDDAPVRGARARGRGPRPHGQRRRHGLGADGDEQGVGGLDARHGRRRAQGPGPWPSRDARGPLRAGCAARLWLRGLGVYGVSTTVWRRVV